jgi:hypothetical protein
MAPTIKECIVRLESHERECLVRYTNIEKRLDEGSAKFRRLENMMWSLFPFILISIATAKWL